MSSIRLPISPTQTLDLSYVKKEKQNGSGNGKNLDKERLGSKNVAVERIRFKGVLGNIRDGQTKRNVWVQNLRHACGFIPNVC